MEIKNIRLEEAFRYMGFGNSTPDESFVKIAKEVEAELLNVVSPKYTYKILDIKNVDIKNGSVTFDNVSVTFEGFDIANHLMGCQKAVLMACTAGDGVDKLLRRYKILDMTQALACDCLGSALIEQICDNAQKEICDKLTGFTTWRYSCGYGDFPLETQKDIVKILDMQKTIGVSISESLLLTPVKSVTAVFGISSAPVGQKRKGCESCNLYNTCNFRKRGERCNA